MEDLTENQRHYQKFKAGYVKRGKANYLKNKEIILARNIKYLRNCRIKVVNHLGAKCIQCGFNDVRALQIDHINGGGRKERNRQTTKFYNRVLADTSNTYQLLCANCNAIKRITNREF